jgi:hypothetical protein
LGPIKARNAQSGPVFDAKYPKKTVETRREHTESGPAKYNDD